MNLDRASRLKVNVALIIIVNCNVKFTYINYIQFQCKKNCNPNLKNDPSRWHFFNDKGHHVPTLSISALECSTVCITLLART